MEHKKLEDGTILIQMLRGEEIVSVLTRFLNEQKIYAGTIQGIGAVNWAEVAVFDAKNKRYIHHTLTGPLEVLALNGNVSRMEDGQSFPHIHAVLGDHHMNARGGHLMGAVADPTCEMVLRPLPGTVERRLIPELGLKLWQLA